jgi:multimeric flavodoxin WrbA
MGERGEELMSTVLGICGSARKKGSTATLLQEVLNAIGADSELIYLSDLNIKFCLGCRKCMEQQGKCVIEDDMAGILDKLLATRAIVVASPNYYYTVSGLMKNMIDRSISLNYRGVGEDTGVAWHGCMPLVDKVGGIVITQAAYGGEKVEETFKCFCEFSGLRWMGTVIASVGSKHVKDYPEYLEEGRDLGRKIRKKLS